MRDAARRGKRAAGEECRGAARRDATRRASEESPARIVVVPSQKRSDERGARRAKVRVRAGAAARSATAYIYPTMQYLAASSRKRGKDSEPTTFVHNSQRTDGRMNELAAVAGSSLRASLYPSLSSARSLSLLCLVSSLSLPPPPPFLSLFLCASVFFFCFITMSGCVCVSVSLGSSCWCRRGWFLALCRVFISSE